MVEVLFHSMRVRSRVCSSQTYAGEDLRSCSTRTETSVDLIVTTTFGIYYPERFEDIDNNCRD